MKRMIFVLSLALAFSANAFAMYNVKAGGGGNPSDVVQLNPPTYLDFYFIANSGDEVRDASQTDGSELRRVRRERANAICRLNSYSNALFAGLGNVPGSAEGVFLIRIDGQDGNTYMETELFSDVGEGSLIFKPTRFEAISCLRGNSVMPAADVEMEYEEYFIE